MQKVTYVVNKNAITPLPLKVEAICNLKQPKTAKQLEVLQDDTRLPTLST